MPGLQHAAYRAQLLACFANPALAHRTQQIAMDGSQAEALRTPHRDTVGRRLDVAALRQVLAYAPVFGDLDSHDTLAHALLLPMQRLQQQGVRGALAAISEPSDD